MKEDTYLQQSKQSIYYKKCLEIYEQISKREVSADSAVEDNSNAHYSPSYALYILNNWCGLLPLWTCLHLGDQGRHGESTVYDQWSTKFSSIDCVQDPPRTQGIIEFHQKSAKHISMNSARGRLDNVVKNLFLAKKSKRRFFEVAQSRKKDKDCGEKVKDTLPNKIAMEKWVGKNSQKALAIFNKTERQ